MKKIVISDGDPKEMKSFMEGLNAGDNKPFELRIHKANWARTGIVSQIRRYIKYFSVPFYYFLHRSEYEYIIGWQQFYALVYCFYCHLLHKKKRNVVVALNYTYNPKSGLIGNIYEWFMRICTDPSYLDYIHVLSWKNADLISQYFRFPRDRIIVTPFGIDDMNEELCNLKRPNEYENEKYFFSIGRSNRDYDFLIESWDGGGDGYKLIIASDTYTGKSSNPIVKIRRDISSENQYKWIVNAEAIIISTRKPQVCSGDTVLLKSMALRKIVVVTKPSALEEMYVRDRENGLVISKTSNDLQKTIREIIQGRYEFIKDAARESYINDYTRSRMGITIGNALRNRSVKSG